MHLLPVGGPLETKLLDVDFPSRLREVNAKRRVSSMRCQPYVNPHDANERPWHLSSVFSEYLVANISKLPLPFHAKEDDVKPFVEVGSSKVDFIVAHRFVIGLGGSIAVLFETRWIGLMSSLWEREMHLRCFRLAILRHGLEYPNNETALEIVDSLPTISS